VSAYIAETAKVFDSAQVSGSAQVFDSARVFGWAQVFDSAQVSGSAQVFDSAQVYGSAQVSGWAEVFDSAQVFGSARVFGSAQVSGDGRVSKPGDCVTVGPVGTGNTITAHRDAKIGWRINAGCWSGTVNEARDNLRAQHLHPDYAALPGSERDHHIRQVRAALTFIAAHIRNEDGTP